MKFTVIITGPGPVMAEGYELFDVERMLDGHSGKLSGDVRGAIRRYVDDRDVLCVIETNEDGVVCSWSPRTSAHTDGDKVPSRTKTKGYRDPRQVVGFYINKRVEDDFDHSRKSARDVPHDVIGEVCAEYIAGDADYDAETITDEVLARSGAACARESVLGHVTSRILEHLGTDREVSV